MTKDKERYVSKTLQQEPKRLSRIIALQRENDIIAMLLDGKETGEIVNYISTKYRLTPKTVAMYMTNAREVIKSRKNYELGNLINTHIARYEDIYAKLYEMGAMAIAMKALVAKEKLFSFHKEGFHMRVTQGQISAVSMQQIGNEYDVMKLDKAKRTRMEELVTKMVEVLPGNKAKGQYVRGKRGPYKKLGMAV
jgi:hypothetical protein